jgi:hypothetical protein
MRLEWNLLWKSFPDLTGAATECPSKWKLYDAFLEVEGGNKDEDTYFQQRAERAYEFAPSNDCFQETKCVDFERLRAKENLEGLAIWMLS